jgi:hypothetical protein
MLKRLFLALLLLAAAGRAAAVDYTDIWYIPAEAGWGVNVVQSDTFMFITFFIYGADGKPTWFTGQVNQDSSSGNFNGTLYSTTGTYYLSPWTGFSGGPAGTVSFQPLGPYNAKLIYTVTGVGTVTKFIQRQNLTLITVGGAYSGAQSGTYSNCSMSTSNGPYRDFFDLQVTQLPDPTGVTDGTVTFAFTYTNFSCTVSGTLVLQGQLYSVPVASYQCSDGLMTPAAMTEIKATAQGVEGRFSAPSVGGNCREDAQFSSVLR